MPRSCGSKAEACIQHHSMEGVSSPLLTSRSRPSISTSTFPTFFRSELSTSSRTAPSSEQLVFFVNLAVLSLKSRDPDQRAVTAVAGRGAHRAAGMASGRQGGIYGGHVPGLLLRTCSRPIFGDHLSEHLLPNKPLLASWRGPRLCPAATANLPNLQLPGSRPTGYEGFCGAFPRRAGGLMPPFRSRLHRY